MDPFFQLETGVTLALPLDEGGPPWFTIYHIVIALFLGLALVSLAGEPVATRSAGWLKTLV